LIYWRKAIFHLIIPIIFKSNENLDNNYLSENHTTDTVPQFDSALVLELLKQNQEFKELLAEQNKHMIEQQQQLIDAGNRLR
jgi:hypothetical protein